MLKSIVAAGLGVALIAALPAGGAEAASFSCRSAKLDAEKAVCTGRHLSALDDELAHWYGKAKMRARYFDQTTWLKAGQREWLGERNACGWDRACLRFAYENRIEWLRNYAEHV